MNVAEAEKKNHAFGQCFIIGVLVALFYSLAYRRRNG
jgi:hypothetical protein